MHFKICPTCEEAFTTRSDLLDHIQNKKHCSVPKREFWDHPEYEENIFN